jgi:hypothetical protein
MASVTLKNKQGEFSRVGNKPSGILTSNHAMNKKIHMINATAGSIDD